MTLDSHRFTIGDFNCIAINDYNSTYAASRFFTNATPDQVRMDLIDREGEIVPGVSAVEAKGHTPGHMAVALASRNEQLLYISDTVLHPLHLEYPNWHTDFYDVDIAQAAASKKRLFDRAAAEEALVLAFHFYPFPSLGHVTSEDEGWRWQPLA